MSDLLIILMALTVGFERDFDEPGLFGDRRFLNKAVVVIIVYKGQNIIAQGAHLHQQMNHWLGDDKENSTIIIICQIAELNHTT